ncbi:ABC transporter ATP-binding protein [Brevibacillus sp. M2.1A]|uniref:ABC transporter ATP-binding protein n=1 Tax=Brevibacillus TaxID=55080 RepID=UPI00156AE9F7|nr:MULTISPECIES: ABC transporter ATP-binding protein [Brevibacillus]MBY0086436.1 ABC transporter ATP-binding protein [Brevibacillus brevis]MCC8437744.1 ABC transporter ATP-binding protein [Brevibacillus sp. M2.1A]MCE0452430.1 ABC transporter ATP-binding protein [Brevibacillus sp. AF8]MCM3142712.1 ABC transporter ATP-binding protein [Brevibacillus sp. MER 51]UKK99866.1 ABC transporter ATP-binding protein [Brevibacillus brevis]
MKKIIHLDSIEKRFADTVVVPSFSLSIEEGEFLTLLGPSGCGKTTLLRMIAGFEQPTTGEIFLDEKPLSAVPPYQRDMNMVFQQYALFPHMTVEQNILFGLKMKKVNAAEQQKRLEEVLQYVQLTELRKRTPKQLSGGQQQRVAIARAIINNPRVLLLDEPLGALDYQLRKSLQLELKNLQKNLGITFIYVTHDQEEAMAMSDRIAVMNKGRIEQIASPAEIYNSPQTLFVATFIGENNIFRENGTNAAVRPEKIKLYPVDSDKDKHKKLGTIADAVFLGNLRKVFIRLEGQDMTVMAHQYAGDGLDWQVGDQVAIGWAQTDEVILPC